MKIIFVVPDMPGGGTERVVSLLANEYAKRGIGVAILLFAGNQVEYKLDHRIEVVSIAQESRGSIRVIFQRILKMRSFYKRNKGCRIFAFSTMGAVFSVIAAAGISHYLLVSERNDPRKSPHRKWFMWAYSKADKVVLQTPDVAAYFPEKIVRKSVVVPNPIDDSLPERFTGIRKKTVVAVGRLEAQKNHALLLEAFAGFCKRFPEYELHIYGVGKLEDELRKKADCLGISRAVVWEGFCSDVKEKIRDAGMYVLSSDYEGISNSMIEAMAMGIPTIATDCPIGGARMMIQDGINGLLVPVRNPIRLMEAMIKLAAEEGLSEKIAMNGYELRDKCRVKEIADRLLEKEYGY